MMDKHGRRLKPQREQAYLLRLWQVENDGCLIWRASVEDARTGERRGFADLALLYTYLAEQTAPHPPGRGAV